MSQTGGRSSIPARGRIVKRTYVLERLLADGGMGSVWAARHLQLDVPVAVKFMASSLIGDPVALARFQREARAAALLRGPHVVQLLDYGMDDEAPFIAMELLVGEDLKTRLDRVRRIGLRATSVVVTQVSRALRLAHEAGIVHRDLKPGNIFLARNGDEEVVKVLDFGIAKEITRSLVHDATLSGTLVGSPYYLSPEQARGVGLDHRSDLWSLAVVAFRALTGRRPFEGSHVGDVIINICTGPLPVATQLAPDLPADIDRFFERAMARNPDQRFGSARELAEAFAIIAEAHPDGPALAPLEEDQEHAAQIDTGIRARMFVTEPLNEMIGEDSPDRTVDVTLSALQEPSDVAPAKTRGAGRWGWFAAGVATSVLVVLGLRGRSTTSEETPRASSASAPAEPPMLPATVVAPLAPESSNASTAAAAPPSAAPEGGSPAASAASSGSPRPARHGPPRPSRAAIEPPTPPSGTAPSRAVDPFSGLVLPGEKN